MEPMKVAIVDDEPMIVEGLSKGMEWNKWNCTVCGTAGDGTEGLRLIREQNPDILITDISMPNLNGLKMIAALKSEFPDMQITILTGFRDFEYARQAIELGVTRFLLKPSKFNELEEAVETMCSRLPKKESPGAEPLPNELEPKTEAANSFIVNKALAFMRENYEKKLRLQDVADEVYVSQWHLSKLLNKHLEQNFSEILNGIRIEKAKELLKDPSLRIGDIAELVGFVDLAHFSRVFKSICGMSANEYRNHETK